MGDMILSTLTVFVRNCQGFKIQSRTSQGSFLDGNFLPKYGEKHERWKALEKKRIRRGLYCSSDGSLINADFNGSANIQQQTYRLGHHILIERQEETGNR